MFSNSSIKRLRYAFAAMAGLTILGLVGGCITFAYNHLIQQRFLTKTTPLLVNVEQLSRVAVRFTSTTQELQTINTLDRLNRALTSHRSQRDALQEGLLDLADHGADVRAVEGLNRVVRDFQSLEAPYSEALRARIDAGSRLAVLRREVGREGRALIDRLNPLVVEGSLQMMALARPSEDQNDVRFDQLSRTWSDVELLTNIGFAAERFLLLVARDDAVTSGLSTSPPREVIAPEFRRLAQLALKVGNPDQRQVLAQSLSIFNKKTLEKGGIADESQRLGEVTAQLDELGKRQIQLVTRMTDLVNRIASNARYRFFEDAEKTRQSSLIAVAALATLSIIALGAIIWIGWRLINRDIAQRLERLADSTVALADGDLDVHVDQSGHDELAGMARAVEIFRQNARELRSSEAELAAYAHELERSNRELDDFAYIASHDLKEPLRATYNHASFLLEDYEDRLEEDGRKRLLRLITLSKRMEQLVADLLYFSRLGRGGNAAEPIDLSTVIADIQADLAETLHARNAEVMVSGALPIIRGHRPHVTALFRNLISNAAKYNDSDEKIIKIGHVADGPEEADNDFETLYVKDNGIGIEARFEDQIFRIFKRLNSDKAYGEGTGAGLSFVKKIVERQGGHIWLSSKPGQGTTFFFTLRRSSKSAKALPRLNAA